jgi:DNA topoisomerase I
VTLTRVDPHGPGLGRRRRGKGFSYFDLTTGDAVTDASTLDRITALVIPPAWRDVWISPRDDGHIQAVGTDAAGRRQYRYHAEWTEQQSREKFERVARLGAQMPEVRAQLQERLERDGLGRERVMAGAVWLLDLGVFRVGGEEYAEGDKYSEASFGLATLRREHASARKDGSVQFRYVAKAGVPRTLTIADPATHRLVTSLKRRRGGGDDLLAWSATRQRKRVWHDVTADDVNDAVPALVGDEFTAKDLRTWNAGVVAAVALATQVGPDGTPPTAERKRKAAVTHTMKTVAAQLGNTPAVCKRSYVDPVLVGHFEAGRTVLDAIREADPTDLAMREQVEAAVLELVTSRD